MLQKTKKKWGISFDVAIALYCLLLSALFLLPLCALRHDCNLKLTIGSDFYLKFAALIDFWRLYKIIFKNSYI